MIAITAPIVMVAIVLGVALWVDGRKAQKDRARHKAMLHGITDVDIRRMVSECDPWGDVVEFPSEHLPPRAPR